MSRKNIVMLMVVVLACFSAEKASAVDRVLTVYFLGTGHRTDLDFSKPAFPFGDPAMHEPTFPIVDPDKDGDRRPDVLSLVYFNNDHSVEIGHKPYSNGAWMPVETIEEAFHYKFIVNGAGTSNVTTADTLGKINPDWSKRTWFKISEEAVAAFRKVRVQYDDHIIVNLLGFSRGGIAAMYAAGKIASLDNDVTINMLCFDPVHGGFDPVKELGSYFALPNRVNQYIGIYAEHERTYMFEPVIPTAAYTTRRLLVRFPGGHETIVGNRQKDGHNSSKNNTEVEDYKNIGILSQVFIEQLLSSPEWGSVEFDSTSGIDDETKFKDIVEEIWGGTIEGYDNHMQTIRDTTFLPIPPILKLDKGRYDSCFRGTGADYDLRGNLITPATLKEFYYFPASLVPSLAYTISKFYLVYKISSDRLSFNGNYRGAPGWHKSNCVPWILGSNAYFSNPVRTFRLNTKVFNRVVPNDWNKLQSFKGPAPDPYDADGDGLPDLVENLSLPLPVGLSWPTASNNFDTDNDGLNDGDETKYWAIDALNNPEDFLFNMLSGFDPDGDGLTNLIDPDSDNDGLIDGEEVNILGTDPAKKDTDGDDIWDGAEDFDSDGLSNLDELISYKTDPNYPDFDNDGLSDGDEIAYWGADWNADPDGDGLVNLFDPDSDNDGLDDGVEVNRLRTDTDHYDPGLVDTDGDGIWDGDEDFDGDGLTNIEELDIYETGPDNPDTDDDGLDDGDEVQCWGADWNADPDLDGLVNLIDPDSDNDGLNDGEEVQCGSNPADPSSRCFKGLPWLMLLLSDDGPPPTCDSSHLNLCTTSNACTNADGFWWSDNTCKSTQEPALCPEGNSFQEACYVFIPDFGITFDAARNSCIGAYGGDLASIHSPAENTHVSNVIDPNDIGHITAYIGFIDMETEGTFVWTDGTPADYLNWRANEPNDAGDSDCTQFWPDNNGSNSGWNDTGCIGAGDIGYVCEFTP